MGLKKDGGFSINKVEGGGWPPPRDPVERPFEGGGPRRHEDVKRVVLGDERLGVVVIVVVRQELVDEEEELMVLFGRVRRPGAGGELTEEAVEVVKPGVVESSEAEAAHCGCHSDKGKLCV